MPKKQPTDTNKFVAMVQWSFTLVTSASPTSRSCIDPTYMVRESIEPHVASCEPSVIGQSILRIPWLLFFEMTYSIYDIPTYT